MANGIGADFSGSYASNAFMLGFLQTSFSSLLGNAIGGV